MEWKRKVDTNLGITVILIFSSLLMIIGFYVVGAQIDGYPFNELSGNVVNSDDDNTVVEDKDVVDDNGKIIDDKNSDNF